ncbi:MAG: hypothetical protein A2Z08_07475 [Deltaproteobacteria bacterium RBG_16_54_11]|jgi:uncharacterized SAM-binding protein YcdF (DUF218 family)|nr:MAG: hypothetical protein A2Z08_07475 [Deltaproteobacteria bacterium RBG_16_54_11]
MRRRPKQSLINPKVRRKQQLRRGKLIFAILIVITISLLIANHQAILAACGKFLIFQQPAPQQADVIVIIANWDDTIIRVRGGADFYKAGLAKAIFVPRMEQMEGLEEIKKLGINIPENRDLVIIILQGLGVPLDAIETSAQEVTNTWDEAQEVSNLIEHKGYKSVLLVTSKYHSRRAYLIFKDALKGKATVISVPSLYDSSDPETWWKRDRDAKKVIMEYQKLLVYYWRKVF